MPQIRKGLIYEENLSYPADTTILGGRAMIITPGGNGWSQVSVAGTYPHAVALFGDAGVTSGGIGDEVVGIHGGVADKVEAGAAVPDGSYVATDSLGRAIVYVPGSDIYLWGVALSAALNPGDFIEVLQFEARGQ